MARVKFLCDADRCIECNACVTACKNEHEVPWGINRRRVVTINDGKPGERSVSMACMHCTDAPCAAVCPVSCFYTTADGMVLHSKDLCIGCGYCFYACPFGAPQYPKVGNFGSRGKMDKCTYCAGGPEADSHAGRIRQIRRQPSRRGQAADLRRDVLDQVAAGRRRRDHRRDLQGARDEARLRFGRMGLDHRLSRGHRCLRRLSAAERTALANHGRMIMMTSPVAHSLYHRCVGNPDDAAAMPVLAQQLGPDGAPNPTASVETEQTLLQQSPRIEGRIDIPNEQGASAHATRRAAYGIISTKSHCTGSARS